MKLYRRTLEKPLKLTADEEDWWERTGGAIRRRAFTDSAGYMTLGFAVGYVIAAATRLASGAPYPSFLLISFLVSGATSGVLMGYFNSRAKRDQAVRSKRLREAMAAADENPAP